MRGNTENIGTGRGWYVIDSDDKFGDKILEGPFKSLRETQDAVADYCSSLSGIWAAYGENEGGYLITMMVADKSMVYTDNRCP